MLFFFTGQIDLTTANRINQANVITLTKQGAGSNPNIFTKLIAERLNFPENALFYINQRYLTVQKFKKIFYGEYFLLGQIHESSNPPSDIQS